MLEFHPLANLFPLIEGAALDELVVDVAANGVREPIVKFEGKILDGRNRYRAANIAHVGYRLENYDAGVSGDPLSWVLSKNLHRRHLSENQRVMIAAEIAKLRQGRPSEWDKDRRDAGSGPGQPQGKPANRPDLSQDDAAELMHVSPRQVRRGRVVVERGTPELVDAVKRDRVAVSSAAELARLPEDEQLEVLRTVEPWLIARVAKERQRVGAGGRATMASRVEPPDSLDYFPTPPWATRALIEDVLLVHGAHRTGMTVWEPACGEGHISGVLEEYFATVIATDVFDYSVAGVSPPGWKGVLDFLGTDAAVEDTAEGAEIDWIITNPPFAEEKTLGFVLRALPLARRGVAVFVRQQWLEGVDRYERLFRDTPPAIYAQFAERVNLCKGRWDPEGSTATAYCWLVWIKDRSGVQALWIPPGRRTARARDTDVQRFTMHPCLPATEPPAAVEGPRAAPLTDVGGGGGTVAATDEVATEAGDAPGASGFRSTPETDAIIRRGYAADPVDLVAMALAIKGELHLTEAPTKLQVRRRAHHIGLSSRARQRAAASQYTTEQNRRRKEVSHV